MAFLTEEQIAAMRPNYNEYPERIVSAPGYPPIRKKRNMKSDQQAGAPGEDPGALPKDGLTKGISSQIWSLFLYKTGPNTGAQRGSQAFRGPGLIHSFAGSLRMGDPTLIVDPIQFSYSETPIPDSNITVATKLPGTVIGIPTISYTSLGNLPFATPNGLLFDAGFSTVPQLIPLGIYIPYENFYLGASIFSRYAGSVYIIGAFRIIENAPPESAGW